MKNAISPEVLIIGAGPIGLALASRLKLANVAFLILEKGHSVGSNILDWGHVNLFTNWAESVDKLSEQLLNKNGIEINTTDSNPSGSDFVNHYLAKLASIIPDYQIQYNSEVMSVQYNELESEFAINYSHNSIIKKVNSKYVFDASGTWQNPTSLVKSQAQYQDFICSGIPDMMYVQTLEKASKVAIVGSGHSAMNSILQLSKRKDLELLWIIRSSQPRFGLSKVGGKSRKLENQIESLINNDDLTLVCGFQLDKIQIVNQKLQLESYNEEHLSGIHKVISNIGSSPNHNLLKNINLNLDEKYAAPLDLSVKINPSLHSCDMVSFNLEDTLVTESNYFLIGSKTFGKASNFLLSKGYRILDQIMIDVFDLQSQDLNKC